MITTLMYIQQIRRTNNTLHTQPEVKETYGHIQPDSLIHIDHRLQVLSHSLNVLSNPEFGFAHFRFERTKLSALS